MCLRRPLHHNAHVLQNVDYMVDDVELADLGRMPPPCDGESDDGEQTPHSCQCMMSRAGLGMLDVLSNAFSAAALHPQAWALLYDQAKQTYCKAEAFFLQAWTLSVSDCAFASKAESEAVLCVSIRPHAWSVDPGGSSLTLQQYFPGFAEAGEPSSASDDDDKENEGGNERPAQRCVTSPQTPQCLALPAAISWQRHTSFYSSAPNSYVKARLLSAESDSKLVSPLNSCSGNIMHRASCCAE